MSDVRLVLYSQQVVLRILIGRDDNLAAITVRRGSQILATSTDSQGHPQFAHVARNFRRQYVEHTLIANLSTLSHRAMVHWLGELELTIETDRETQREKVHLEPGLPVDLVGLPTPALRRLLTIRPHLTKVLNHESATQRSADDTPYPINIEFSAASGGLLLIQGWCANAASSALEFYSGGLSSSTLGTMAFGPRPDVSSYLREQGFEVDDDMHGFVAILSIPFSMRLRGYLHTRQGFRLVYDDSPKAKGSPNEAVERLISMWRGGVYSWERTTETLAPFLQPLTPVADAYQCCINAAVDRPRLSVIVPFYREWRFAFAILRMIERSPNDWEWILVCDDNGIHQTLFEFIREQPVEVKSRITYIRTLTNMGYGLSNNIGVSLASSDFVLLMNSDIWIDDCAVIDLEVDAMHSNDRKVVGFRLLFEDDTLQHDGIRFQECAELGNRMICTHPRKGIPEGLVTEKEAGRELADAVTGALLLMPKALFETLGGFSSDYIGGDFEDADLCLQVTAAGGVVELARLPGLYHLERQSIRHDFAGGVSLGRTLVNCEQFNRRWFAERLALSEVQG